VTLLSRESFAASSPSETSCLLLVQGRNAATASTVSPHRGRHRRPDPFGKHIRDQFSDHPIILGRGDDRAGLVAVPRSSMKERSGADQRQQGDEIAPLPNGNRQHKLGQLFGEWNDDSTLARRNNAPRPSVTRRHCSSRNG
jgi:hypothetical protein